MTYDQHIASDPALSVWVSASAGTGKTKVLTDRVLRLLLAGSRPSKILCITYTKAAAAEMEHRIGEQLGQWAIAEEAELRKTLSELTGKAPDAATMKRARQLFALVLDAPERVRIQTIHGFCQSVLKRFPLEADVAPHFTVIDDHTSTELLAEARRQLFSRPGDGECAKAIEAIVTQVSEAAFNDLMLNIVNDRREFAVWFERENGADMLRERVFAQSGISISDTEDSLFHKHFRYSNTEVHALRTACAALAQAEGESDRKTFEALQAWLASIMPADKAMNYACAYLTSRDEPRKTLCTRAAEKLLPGLKDILLAEQQRAYSYVMAMKSLFVAKNTVQLITLAETLLGIYQRLKDAHGYLDYDDIIQRTVSLLHQKNATAWVLYKLDGGVDHLLVDEAQDTSPEQWRLVDALTSEFFAGSGAHEGNRTLFVVGDGKQSVFSFQGAAPQEFDTMRTRLQKRIGASGKELHKVNLQVSFRSTEPVLRAVDNVFSSDTAREGLTFSENYLEHKAYRTGMAGRVELWPLVEVDDEEENFPAWHVADKQLSSAQPEAVLAADIAKQVKHWLQSRRKIASQDRPVQPGDILILVQRRGGFASAMLRALKRENIPVAGADRLVLTGHIAVADCIALAEFLLLPQDDLTLATVLKSPFIGLPEEALFELAYDRKGTLWQRLKEFASNTPPPQGAAKPHREGMTYQSAYLFLSGLLAKADYMSPYELFAHILETLGGRRKLAERLGMEIDDPLNEFLELSLQYAEAHTPTLQGFLHWLLSGMTEVKRDMEKTRDEVRIMTVHGAKGLQAPVVFLPDTTRLPRPDSGLLWTEDPESLPLWTPCTDDEDMLCRDLREKRKIEREHEYRRLLYVAMTRAEDELYICGWKGGNPVSGKSWYALISEAARDKWQAWEDKLILTAGQTVPPKTRAASVEPSMVAQLPQWIAQPPASELSPSKPLSPSRMEPAATAGSPLQDQAARLRGVLIHRLLQHLPDVQPYEHVQVIDRFISRHEADFNQEARAQIKQEVLTILSLPDFTPLFSGDSLAEAQVSGVVMDDDGNPVTISGQIDRLAVLDNEVYIIDYKTGSAPQTKAETPKAYLKQMAAYQRLIARIYPDKTIRCALLWTAVPKLMIIS